MIGKGCFFSYLVEFIWGREVIYIWFMCGMRGFHIMVTECQTRALAQILYNFCWPNMNKQKIFQQWNSVVSAFISSQGHQLWNWNKTVLTNKVLWKTRQNCQTVAALEKSEHWWTHYNLHWRFYLPINNNNVTLCHDSCSLVVSEELWQWLWVVQCCDWLLSWAIELIILW